MNGDSPLRLAVIALLCVTLGAAVATAPGGAADNPGLLHFEPSDVDADAGEEFTIDVLLTATADYDDDGVIAFNYTLAYDPEVLTATEIDVGPWMEQGEDTEVIVDTEIDEASGYVHVEQAREPPAGGVEDLGDTPTATIRFAVADDAPAVDAIIAPTDAHAQLTEYPLPVLTTREVTASIDGGGETRMHPDLPESDDDPGVTLADGDEAPTDEDDPIAWRGLAAMTIVAVFLATLLAIRRR